MPVLMSYLPVPSRLMAAAIRVSLVARDTNARRPPLPGVVRSWLTALGEAFFLTAWRAIPAVLSLAGCSYRNAGRTVERNARQNDAQEHGQAAQYAGRRQRIAKKRR